MFLSEGSSQKYHKYGRSCSQVVGCGVPWDFHFGAAVPILRWRSILHDQSGSRYELRVTEA